MPPRCGQRAQGRPLGLTDVPFALPLIAALTDTTTRAALALTCKAAYREMQRSPGAWHPTVDIVKQKHWRDDEDSGAASLLAWLERYRPQLAADGINYDTLSRMVVEKNNWQTWPIVTRCAGQLTRLKLPVPPYLSTCQLPDLALLPALQELNIQPLVSGGLDQLAHLQQRLTSLTLRGFGAGANGRLTIITLPQAVAQLSALRRLVLSGQRSVHSAGEAVTGPLPLALSQLSSLEHLAVPAWHVSGNWLPALGPLQRLTFLDASLPLYQAGLPAECALLTQLRQLVIRNVGAGYRHLPPSLSALTLDLVDCEPEPPDSNGEGGIPDLRHLAQLCRLSLPDYKVSAGVELLPDSLTSLHMTLAGEAHEHDCGVDVWSALPEALLRLTRLQSLRLPRGEATAAVGSGFEHLPLSLTELVVGIDGPPVPPPLARLTALRRLDMGWGLQHLPPGVAYFT